MLCKLVNRFKQINPYWFLGDATEMRDSNVPISTPEVATTTPSSLSGTTSGTLFDLKGESSALNDNSNIAAHLPNVPISTLGSSNIAKIIIVYNDHSFEELLPRK
jgi:hypothetical protein